MSLNISLTSASIFFAFHLGPFLFLFTLCPNVGGTLLNDLLLMHRINRLSQLNSHDHLAACICLLFEAKEKRMRWLSCHLFLRRFHEIPSIYFGVRSKGFFWFKTEWAAVKTIHYAAKRDGSSKMWPTTASLRYRSCVLIGTIF